MSVKTKNLKCSAHTVNYMMRDPTKLISAQIMVRFLWCVCQKKRLSKSLGAFTQQSFLCSNQYATIDHVTEVNSAV